MGNVKNPMRTIQTDFRSGEVDPQLMMRTDSKMYPSGAKSLKNCILRSGGSVSRRPGTTRLASMGAAKRRFVAFEYDADEKYIFAFAASGLIVYDGSGGVVQTITSMPWSSDTLVSEMTYSQAGDTMIVCHKSFKPKVIRRTSLSTFTTTDFAFTNSPNNAKIYQPYLKFEDATVTLQPSGLGSGTSITVTANTPIFSSAWVGDTIRIYGVELTITGYTSTTVVTATPKTRIKKRLDPNPFLSTDGSKVIEVTDPFHGLVSGVSVNISGVDAGSSGIGITKANLNGTFTITVIDEDRYSYTAGGSSDAALSTDFGGSAVNIESTAATRSWDEQVFSARRGWPAAVCFHEDRLWFGGSTQLPDGLFSSHTGFYYDFSVGKGEDDASIQVTVGAPRIAKIKHILAGRLLQVFAEGGEFVARQSDGVALTPATVSVRPQTPYGCSTVKPMAFDGATLFIQGNNKTVREFTYDFNQDGFAATDLTTLSAHLLGTVVDADVLYGSNTRTEQYAFFINSDGTMAVFHSNRAEGLAGWMPWVTDATGLFESVCVLGSRLYVSVNRGGTRFLEQIELDNSAVLLDWSISQSNATAKTSWSLGSAYASKTLHVTSNGYYLGTVTANGSGTITTPYAVKSICAGYLYDWQVIPLPPDMGLPDGPLTGETRRIVSANIHLYNTLSLNVNGQTIVATQIGSDLSVAPTPLTGKQKRFLFGYNRDPAVQLTQSQPLPVTILGMTLEVSF